MDKQTQIRNFCIIAHIDHGKSTLADRLLELTNTISQRKMKAQILDQMDLERERGITIKLQPVRMNYQSYELNLIDTPGHVDFSYEVSRSLAAVEGAILLVDATQGIQAQTVANLYLALEQDLTIIPVINKIDLKNANIEATKKEVANLLGINQDEILLISAKTGQGVKELLEKIIEQIPPPSIIINEPAKALIFDSKFDEYKGVIAYVKMVSGILKSNDRIKLMASKTESEIVEVGYFTPGFTKDNFLNSGEIGYIATGLKDVDLCQVGDTIADLENTQPLPGYKEVQPMVFAGIFCHEGQDYEKLREAIEKLKLNDAALIYEPENSPALGFGFRCGFLGLLHLEVIQERLKREYGLDVIITTPSVAYNINLKNRNKITIRSPQELPPPEQIEEIFEPYVNLDIYCPKKYLGSVMQLVSKKRGIYKNTEYLEDIGVLHYDMPLVNLLFDFYDKLKSTSSGYASLNYDIAGYQKCDIVKLDILVAEDMIDALSTLVYKDEAYLVGRIIVETLKKHIPRQQFMVKIQAAIGGKVIAAERLSALRKDVTAKLYGGDYTRKRKLLEKQKKGKKKMGKLGKVNIPDKAFLAVLER